MEITEVIETIKCPYCGEEIAVEATKCKHCGEWLQEDEEDGSRSIGRRISISLVLFGVGWALFHFGSWHLVLGKKINIYLQYFTTGQLKQQDFILGEGGLVFRINEKYYGLAKDVHFFDSSVIQWAMLFLSLLAFIWAIQLLFTGSFGSDD